MNGNLVDSVDGATYTFYNCRKGSENYDLLKRNVTAMDGFLVDSVASTTHTFYNCRKELENYELLKRNVTVII